MCFATHGVYLRLLVVAAHMAHGAFAETSRIARIAHRPIGKTLRIVGLGRLRQTLLTGIEGHVIAMVAIGGGAVRLAVGLGGRVCHMLMLMLIGLLRGGRHCWSAVVGTPCKGRVYTVAV